MPMNDQMLSLINDLHSAPLLCDEWETKNVHELMQMKLKVNKHASCYVSKNLEITDGAKIDL